MLNFKHFVNVGRELGHLHVHYESIEPKNGVNIDIKGQAGGLFSTNAFKRNRAYKTYYQTNAI